MMKYFTPAVTGPDSTQGKSYPGGAMLVVFAAEQISDSVQKHNQA
jgi:hypothetical protein